MARNTQQFETVVTLNAQQAQNQLAKMEENLKNSGRTRQSFCLAKATIPRICVSSTRRYVRPRD